MQIHRRDFVRLAGLGVARRSRHGDRREGRVRPRAEPTAPPAAKAMMKVGTQHGDSR